MKKSILLLAVTLFTFSCSKDDGPVVARNITGVYEVVIENRNPEMKLIRGLVQAFGVNELSSIMDINSMESSKQGLDFDFNKFDSYRFKTEENSNSVAVSLNFITSEVKSASFSISFYFDGELKGTVEKEIDTPEGFFQFGEGYDISSDNNFRINTKTLAN